ncbi:MAG: sodium ion-translocating decarboxylase subunit beta [Clostridiales bacterium]|nr:sodium ion-translocating decarboxylase subunit beta [Clostridiales bacterium]
MTLGWQHILMYIIGGVLIMLAIKKEYEPSLLLPIGFGAILVNLPLSTVWLTNEGEPGFLHNLYDFGIITEMFPLLIFIAVGAMIDFSQLLKTPKMLLFGAAAQFGIFFTALAALAIGAAFPELGIGLKEAGAIGIIGAADGPTSIVAGRILAPDFLGPITVAAYSYMSLVPVIQPPVIKALTTKKERLIRMNYKDTGVSKTALIIFPIVVTIVAGVLAPESASLIGSLMFGNLIRECGVLERLSKSAQTELANLITLLLGITIGATMKAEEFWQVRTLLILGLGFVAFVFDTAGGVLFAKLLNLFSKEKINPMVGAAGISAFPMSARIIQKMAKDEDPTNFILMQSVSANVSGQLGSVIAGGFILHLIPLLLAR